MIHYSYRQVVDKIIKWVSFFSLVLFHFVVLIGLEMILNICIFYCRSRMCTIFILDLNSILAKVNVVLHTGFCWDPGMPGFIREGTTTPKLFIFYSLYSDELIHILLIEFLK